MLEPIFGKDGIKIAQKLAAKCGAGIKANLGLGGSTDVAAVAAKRMGNLRSALDQLKGSIEDIQIGVGEKFLPGPAAGAKFRAEWLPKISTEAMVAAGGIATRPGPITQ